MLEEDVEDGVNRKKVNRRQTELYSVCLCMCVSECVFPTRKPQHEKILNFQLSNICSTYLERCSNFLKYNNIGDFVPTFHAAGPRTTVLPPCTSCENYRTLVQAFISCKSLFAFRISHSETWLTFSVHPNLQRILESPDGRLAINLFIAKTI